jgi:glycerol-3-phosphate O-acyltransferase
VSVVRRNWIRYFWWLRRILYLWVNSRMVPTDPKQELGLDLQKPICYVVRSNSLSDLLVLDEHCRRTELPRPVMSMSALRKGKPGASYIYLVEMNLLQAARRGKKIPPSPLIKLVEHASATPDFDVQLVPVSVFWGRNPGKEEKSIFKLLFFDDERAGVLQKLFIVLAQGGAAFAEFGKPVLLRDQLDPKISVEEVTRKISRVLRVYFRRTRTAAVGPSLTDPERTMETIVRTKPVRDAIEDEMRKKNISEEEAVALARSYIEEIAADVSWPVVRAFERMLGWLWNRIFSGLVIRNSDRVRALAKTHTIIYMPSHRSHMDYLLISYCLYGVGLFPPLTAAGINLNFWPVGGILRRSGAFYLRRTFGGNRLYATVFNEYMHFIVTRGHPINFFVEGGRSRTGRLLNPKTGMLAMVVHSFLRSHERPIALIPMFVGYDKVMEVGTYVNELRGSKKRSESVSGLIKARRALKKNFGRAWIGFGEPIFLDDFLTVHKSDWRSAEASSEVKPPWMAPLVHQLAGEVMKRINSSAIAYPVALASTVLLSIPHRALAIDDLCHHVGLFREIIRRCKYSPDVDAVDESPEAIVAIMEKVGGLSRLKDSTGDVLYIAESEAILLHYYRNSIQHLFVMPSLVAGFFQYNDSVSEDELLVGCSVLFPLLAAEFFLPWSEEEVGGVVLSVIGTLVDLGLLDRTGSRISRPSVTSREFVSLKMLGRTIGSTIERWSIATVLLAQFSDGGVEFSAADFVEKCHLTAQRIAVLNGIADQDFADKAAFKAFVERIKSLGYIEESGEKLVATRRFATMAHNAATLMSVDMRQSIQRVLSTSQVTSHGGGQV